MDDYGVVRVRIGSFASDAWGLAVMDVAGKERLSLMGGGIPAGTNNGAPVLLFSDAAGQTRAILTLGPDGRGALFLEGEGGVVGLKGTALVFADENGNELWRAP